MSKKATIIYIYPHLSSFIEQDIRLLDKEYTIKTQNLAWSSVPKLFLNWLKQFSFLLTNLANCKVIVINFAGYFSLLPVLLGKFFRKKTILILNGTECVSFPTYGYGSLRKKTLKFFIKKSLENASVLLPVDASLVTQIHTFDDSVVLKKQGFKTFFPNISTPVKVIPNGFDTDFWNYDLKKVKKGFITVAAINQEKTALFKGLDLVLEMAKTYREEKFTVVGISEEIQKKLKFTSNVTCYTFLDKEKLKELYQNHQFYIQLSINEGFGCALAEAMLCGCIPIVSNTGALPNVVGSSGIIVDKRNIENISRAVNKGLSLIGEEYQQKSIQSREQIVNNFALSIRENLLLQQIQK